MKVKYTNSKWFLENNGEWIEIDEKDWEKVKEFVFKERKKLLSAREVLLYKPSIETYKPTPDTEYQLDGIGFEIVMAANEDVDPRYEEPMSKKVAHLKVEQHPLHSIQITKSMIICNGRINVGGYCDKCGREALSSSGYCSHLIEQDLKVERRKEQSMKPLSFDEQNLINRVKQRVYLDSDEDIMNAIDTHFKKQEQSEVERLREELMCNETVLANLKNQLKKFSSKLSQLPKEEEQEELWNQVIEIWENDESVRNSIERLKSQFTICRK